MTEKISLNLILKDEVQQLLDNFASVIHAKVVLFDRDGKVIRRGRNEGNSRFCTLIQECYTVEPCMSLDREKQLCALKTGFCQSYVCHAGLREAVMPVTAGLELLGFVAFGQFRCSDELPACVRRVFRSGSRREELLEAYRALPLMTDVEMANLTGLMRLLVNYIVRSELITHGNDFLYSAVQRYLESNLTSEITLAAMARHLGRSTSSVSHFLKARGTTFKRLLIEKRIAHAENLLRGTPGMTIKEAADQSGFSDPYYFSRMYRRYRGMSPAEYKKKLR